MKHIIISTSRDKQVIDITERVTKELSLVGVETGIVNIAVLHTTCAVTTADLDPGTDLDMLDAFESMIPKLNYRHPHDPSHVPDHILSTLIGTSLAIPIKDGVPILGTWQRIVLMEFSGPRERELLLTVLREQKL